MVPEQIDRMTLRWSREDLARYSGVSLASVILIERFGSATETDDVKIRDALARGLAERSAARDDAGAGLNPRTGQAAGGMPRAVRPNDDGSQEDAAPRTCGEN